MLLWYELDVDQIDLWMILQRVYYWVKFNRLQNSLINVLIRNLTTDLWLACPKMLQCRKFGITGLKSSLRVTEKYAYCLVYLHFIWRYGFPKLNATYNFTIKQQLKRKYRAKFLKCMFLQAELERGSKGLNLMCYWSKFQLWLRPLILHLDLLLWWTIWCSQNIDTSSQLHRAHGFDSWHNQTLLARVWVCETSWNFDLSCVCTHYMFVPTVLSQVRAHPSNFDCFEVLRPPC